MITFLRRHINSKLGGIFAIIFLGLIGFAFVGGDIEHKGGSSLGSLFSGSNAAKVGGTALSGEELQSRVQRVYEQQRREQPGLQFNTLLAEDGVNQIADQLIAGLALSEFAKDQGVFPSKRLVDAQISTIPAFQDASGKFSQAAFRQLLSSQGIREEALRKDIERDIIGRLLTSPASAGARLSTDMVLPYASLLLEAREGRIAAIPAAAFAPTAAPSDAQLNQYYKANAARFTLPEQRKLRYAVIDTARFAAAASPSDAEIAAAYAKDKAKYAARETRAIEQLILPSEAAAKAAMAKPLAIAAQEAGLSVAKLPSLSQADLAKQSSDAVAKAAFATAQGQMAGPVRSALGWAVIRVSAVNKIPEVSLAQARGDIVKQLAAQKQAKLMSDFTAKLEDQSANGATFDEVVKENGLTSTETPPLVSTGQNVDDPAYKAAPEVAALLKPGFDMEADDEAQLVPLGADGRFALLDVGDIIAAAPPPLAKVRDLVIAQYQLDQGAAKAKQVAEALRAKIAKGMALDQALSQSGAKLPAPQKVAGRRADLMRNDQPAPQEIAMLFSLPKGAVKIVPIPEGRGYFLVTLDTITQHDAAKVPGLVDKVRGDLGSVVGNEYAAQLGKAMERHVGVKRNPTVIANITSELSRINGGSQR